MAQRSFLESLYRGPLGQVMSALAWGLARFQHPFMVYGFKDPASGAFRKYTRISSNVIIMNRKALAIGDNVWVWHHSILDATEGLEIGEGCQIGAWVGLFSHGSESSIRLLGSQFVHIHNTQRRGYTRGRVVLGPYTFVGAGAKILPGVSVGKGCLIGAGALVTKDLPDYAIAVGSPAQVRGSTLDLDRKFFQEFDFSATYYDATALERVKNPDPQ